MVTIEVKKANEWDALMAGSEKVTPKQMVLVEFEKLEPQAFIICPVAEGRTQEQYVQDVSVFLNKKSTRQPRNRCVSIHQTPPRSSSDAWHKARQEGQFTLGWSSTIIQATIVKLQEISMTAPIHIHTQNESIYFDAETPSPSKDKTVSLTYSDLASLAGIPLGVVHHLVE